MRWAGHIPGIMEKKNACRILVGKSETFQALETLDIGGRTILKLVLRNKRWGSVDYITVAQDRDQWRAIVNLVMNFQAPENAGKILSG
jgi:hypothetical protein